MSDYFPPAPPPPEAALPTPDQPPRALRPVVGLLLTNLGLSVLLTILVLIFRNSVIDYQVAHRHIAGADLSEQRNAYRVSLWTRVVGNIVVSIVYVFLVRALLRGRRWAYRRVIWLGAVGILGLVLVLATPYPVWMHVEQVLQALVLAALLFFVTRPDVRQHFAKGLPGRDIRRFRR